MYIFANKKINDRLSLSNVYKCMLQIGLQLNKTGITYNISKIEYSH